MSELETDFLNDPALTEEAPETPEVVEVQTETAEVKPEATAAPEVREEQHVPLAALRAEREKRQRLERELAERQPQQPQVDFYQQPDVYVQQHLQSVEQRATARMFAALEESAREQYSDYDDVTGAVIEQAYSNPVLAQQIVSSANPALAAYRLGKQFHEMQQMQNPVAYRQKIEAEVRASVEAEFRDKEAARLRAAAAVPPDLSDARNAKGQFASTADNVFNDIF